MADQPNILWICTDQQRWDTLGCYGNTFVTTPNLDKLAANGMVFDNAFSQSPICTPSRASFLTGRYPRTTRDRQNGQNIPDDEVLVTKLLADAGYTCGLSGKLHLSTCHPKYCPDTERRIDDGYSIFHWSHHPGPDWPTNEYGIWLSSRDVKFKRNVKFDDSKHVLEGMPEEHHQTTWCVNKAIDFLSNAENHGRPWLFSVNIFDPHFSFDPPRAYLEPYLEKLEEIPLPNYVEGELVNKPHTQQPDVRAQYGGQGPFVADEMSAGEHRLATAAYWAMCDLIDAQVGRLLDALEATGQAENTIVIFMSDHGEMLGDHNIYWKGPWFYEPAVHVPLIVSWPAKIKPGRSKALVELQDLAPALLEAAGLEPHPGMQAKSLLPLLLGEADPDRHQDDIYCEYYNGMPCKAEEHGAFATMLRDERYKLVVNHGWHVGELYDLEEDPTESKNLWADPSRQERKLAMMKRLCDRMAFMCDPLPERLGMF